MGKKIKTRAIPRDLALSADTLGVNLDRLRFLDAYLRKMVDTGEHSFITLRALRRGALIFNGNYGVSSPGGARLKEDDIFPVQSVSKPVVATLCAILQEEGEIDFWDKAQRYFPEFEGEGKDEVLLWHLLSHVSGADEDAIGKYVRDYIENDLGLALPGADSPDSAYNDLALRVLEKTGLPSPEPGENAWNKMFNALGMKAPLAAKPATAFSYYNYGYGMLAEIIECCSGESLEAFARSRIFEPLGMTDTHWVLPKAKYPRFVTRDPSFRSAEWLNGEDMMLSTSPSGGLKTTMPDLLRFGQMYLQNGTLGGKRILSPASVRLVTTDHNRGLPDSFWAGRWLGANWGFGWNVCSGKKDDRGMLRSNRTYDHGGYGGACLMVDPDSDLVVACYLVEQDDIAYPNHPRTFNILYSALD
jgi:CubicO group peptidase (beta-lactamase class C family)